MQRTDAEYRELIRQALSPRAVISLSEASENKVLSMNLGSALSRIHVTSKPSMSRVLTPSMFSELPQQAENVAADAMTAIVRIGFFMIDKMFTANLTENTISSTTGPSRLKSVSYGCFVVSTNFFADTTIFCPDGKTFCPIRKQG